VASFTSTMAILAVAFLVFCGMGARAVPKALSIEAAADLRSKAYSGLKTGFGKGSFGYPDGTKVSLQKLD